MEQNIQNVNKKVRWIILIVSVVALVGSVAWFAYVQSGKYIEFVVAPSDATIYIDDNRIRGLSTRLPFGEYEMRVERAGFETYEDTITLSSDNQRIVTALTPITQEAIEISQTDEAFLLIEDQAGEEARQTGDSLRSANPIIEHLPHKTFFLSIGYRLDPSDPAEESIIIEIDANEGYRELALQQIRNWGHDPTLLNINFADYRSPFNE